MEPGIATQETIDKKGKRYMFVPMPMPQWIPMGLGGGNSNGGGNLTSPTPTRVEKALQLLEIFHRKQMDRAVVNENMVQVIDGLELSNVEDLALHAACSCLESYFLGKLPMDVFEKGHLESKNKHDGMLINCPNCYTAGNKGMVPAPSCKFCKGSGSILVTPAISPPSE
jgi:hypothetical protein